MLASSPNESDQLRMFHGDAVLPDESERSSPDGLQAFIENEITGGATPSGGLFKGFRAALIRFKSFSARTNRRSGPLSLRLRLLPMNGWCSTLRAWNIASTKRRFWAWIKFLRAFAIFSTTKKATTELPALCGHMRAARYCHTVKVSSIFADITIRGCRRAFLKGAEFRESQLAP